MWKESAGCKRHALFGERKMNETWIVGAWTPRVSSAAATSVCFKCSADDSRDNRYKGLR